MDAAPLRQLPRCGDRRSMPGDRPRTAAPDGDELVLQGSRRNAGDRTLSHGHAWLHAAPFKSSPAARNVTGDAAQSPNADRSDHLEKPYTDAARATAYRQRARPRKGLDQIVAGF